MKILGVNGEGEVMLDSGVDIEQQRVHFNKLAEDYNRLYNNTRTIFVRDSVWDGIAPYLQRLSKKKHLIILDAMCGSGEAHDALKKILDNDFTYEAFDYAPLMVEAARKRFPQSKIWEQDITKFVEHEKYDVIVIYAGLHHIHLHIEESLKRIYSALKPNGIFIIYEPTHGNALFGKIRETIYKKLDVFDEKTERGFAVNELNNLMIKYRFKVEEQYYPGLLSHVLWGVPAAFPFLNKGPMILVRAVTFLEKPFRKTWLAQFLSFTTMSIFKKT